MNIASSANNDTVALSVTGMSLVHTRYSNGDRHEPCDTLTSAGREIGGVSEETQKKEFCQEMMRK